MQWRGRVALHSRELNTDVCVYCRWSAARGAEERGGGGRVRKLSARLWTGVVTVPVVNLYSIKRHLTRVQSTAAGTVDGAVSWCRSPRAAEQVADTYALN